MVHPLSQAKQRRTSQGTPQLEVVAEGVALSTALAVAGRTLGLSSLMAISFCNSLTGQTQEWQILP